MTFFLFLVVAVNARAETAKLTTPTIQRCPAQQKSPEKIDFFLRLGAHLQLTPIN